MNTIPGSRQFLKNYLPFLSDNDNFWLYIYHERNYGPVINSMINSTVELQNLKRKALQNSGTTKNIIELFDFS